MDVEATTAIRQAEVLAAKRMIERTMERFDLYPAKLMGRLHYPDARRAAEPTQSDPVSSHHLVRQDVNSFNRAAPVPVFRPAKRCYNASLSSGGPKQKQ